MKYDASIVGEAVITPSDKEGTIISVSKDGTVKVRFKDAFCGDVRRKKRKIKRQNN